MPLERFAAVQTPPGLVRHWVSSRAAAPVISDSEVYGDSRAAVAGEADLLVTTGDTWPPHSKALVRVGPERPVAQESDNLSIRLL